MMEWFNNNQQQEEQHMQVQMERQNQNGVGVGGALNVKVMTDEQMEMLRRQISVYATICEQLVEMHQSLSSTQDLSGMMFLNPYYDPLVASGGQKIASRQRWTPTPAQLQILEQIYEQGHGTPGKKRIKEITTELTQHGQITETNVYNWFQNRRARTKRKQNAESEMESPNEMKTLPECSKSVESSSPRAENMFFGGHDHIGIGQLIGKMDLPETFSPYCHLVDMTSLDDASNESLLCLNRTLSK